MEYVVIAYHTLEKGLVPLLTALQVKTIVLEDYWVINVLC